LIVRDFVLAAQQEVRASQRAMERAADKMRSGVDSEEVLKTIDAAAAEAAKKVEQHANAAMSQLSQVDDISLQTELNRRFRIRNQLREMKRVIVEIHKEVTDSVRGHTEKEAWP